MKTGQVKLAFNPMLDHADRSLQAHNAAECAGEQGKFWPLHDLMFERQDDLWRGDIRDTIKMLAGELDLDQAQFQSCIDEQRYVGLVQNQDQQRRDLGIRARPTFDVNGEIIVGAVPFEAFQNVIEPMLADN